MRLRKHLLWAAAAGAVAFWVADRARDAMIRVERELATTRQRLAELRQPRDPEPPEAVTEDPTGKVAATAQPPTAAPPFLLPTKAEAKRLQEQKQALLLRDPELQRWFETRTRANTALDYEPFFRRIGLEADESARLVDAKVKWDMAVQDLKAVKLAEGLDGDDPALVELRKTADQALVTEFERVLGPEGVDLFKSATAGSTARNYLRQMGGELSRMDRGFTPSQVDGLLAALVEVSGKTSPNPQAFSEAQWRALAEKTQPLLDPDQWTFFTNATLLLQSSRAATAFESALRSAQQDEKSVSGRK